MRWLAIVACSGCAMSIAAGPQTLATSTSAKSVEAEVAFGGGIGDRVDAFELRGEAGIGAGTGGLEGRIMTGTEYVRFGYDFGWQAGVYGGVPLGAFQDHDLAIKLGGGPHWNLAREATADDIKIVSLALDVGIGYAIGNDGHSLFGDGALFSVGIALRYDRVDLTAGGHVHRERVSSRRR